MLDKKMFGLFWHTVYNRKVPLVRGFDDHFLMPHSGIRKYRRKILPPAMPLRSGPVGCCRVFLAMSENGRKIFVMGHPEYGRMQLRREYERDRKKYLDTAILVNYFLTMIRKRPPRLESSC